MARAATHDDGRGRGLRRRGIHLASVFLFVHHGSLAEGYNSAQPSLSSCLVLQ